MRPVLMPLGTNATSRQSARKMPRSTPSQFLATMPILLPQPSRSILTASATRIHFHWRFTRSSSERYNPSRAAPPAPQASQQQQQVRTQRQAPSAPTPSPLWPLLYPLFLTMPSHRLQPRLSSVRTPSRTSDFTNEGPVLPVREFFGTRRSLRRRPSIARCIRTVYVGVK